MDIVEINSDEAIIEAVMDIYNPNEFEIITRDIKILTTTLDGKEVSNAVAEGGVIKSKNNLEISTISRVNYGGETPDTLKIIVTGEIGIIIGIMERTLPFSTNIITSYGELVNNLVSPNMDITIDFKELTQNNVNINFILNLYNPNSFNVTVENIHIDIKNNNSELIGNLSLPNSIIVAENNTTINGKGSLDIKALDSDKLYVNITSTIIGHIAGYDQSIPVFIKTTIIVPDLKTLLSTNIPTDAIIYSEYKPSTSGLINEITLKLNNPNLIDFDAKDITLEIFRIDNDKKRIIGSISINGGILKANDTTQFNGNIIIPYEKVFIPPPGCRFLPDWLEIKIRANISIQGLKNYFWVGMTFCQDLHLFREDTLYSNLEIVDWK